MSTILSLPSELRHIIAELCGSPGTLASLARTHSGYQIEAEQALYHTVCIVTLNSLGQRCLETLATNSRKAGYVRVLQVDHRKQITSHLLQALINMHSLYDLRLSMNLFEKGIGAWIKVLENILCEGHFRLQTFYCHYDTTLDVSRIFKSQTGLQILGICRLNSPYILLETLKEFHNTQSFLPMVFTMESGDLSIFPGFYAVDRIATISQLLVESLDKEDLIRVSQLSIYLVDSSNLSTIHALAKDMAMILPQITKINFSFERRCAIPPQEMKGVLSSFSNLRHLNLCLWSYRPQNPGSISDRRANVKEWKRACPQITSLFINGLLHFRRA